MAMAFGAKESTGVILPMLCMADIMAVCYYKRIADWKTVAGLLPTAVVGFFIVRIFPEKAFRRFIQGVTVLSVIMMLV